MSYKNSYINLKKDETSHLSLFLLKIYSIVDHNLKNLILNIIGTYF